LVDSRTTFIDNGDCYVEEPVRPPVMTEFEDNEETYHETYEAAVTGFGIDKIVKEMLKFLGEKIDTVKQSTETIQKYAVMICPLQSLITTLVNIWYMYQNCVLTKSILMFNLAEIVTTFATVSTIFSKIAKIKNSMKLFGPTLYKIFQTVANNRYMACSDFVPEFMIKTILLVVSCLFPVTLGLDFVKKITYLANLKTSIDKLFPTVRYLLEDVFGVYDSEKKELEEIIRNKMIQADEFISIPAHKWYGEVLERAEAFSHETFKLFQKTQSIVNGEIKTALCKKLSLIDERITHVRAEINSRKAKPDPVAIYLYSEGGVGKTNWVQFIAKRLAERLEGFNDGIYSLPASTTKHFSRYQNQDTMLIDEVGDTVRQPTEGINAFSLLNSLLSTTPTPCPGASIDEKNQILSPKLVAMLSNIQYDRIGSELTDEARRAQKSRLLEFQFYDPQFVTGFEGYRYKQSHRQPDFSHIKFLKRNVANEKEYHQLLLEQEETGIKLVYNSIEMEEMLSQLLITRAETASKRQGCETFLKRRDECIPCNKNIAQCIWFATKGEANVFRKDILTDVARNMKLYFGHEQIVKWESREFDENVPQIVLCKLNGCIDFHDSISRLHRSMILANDSIFLVSSNYGPQKFSDYFWANKNFDPISLSTVYKNIFGFNEDSKVGSFFSINEYGDVLNINNIVIENILSYIVETRLKRYSGLNDVTIGSEIYKTLNRNNTDLYLTVFNAPNLNLITHIKNCCSSRFLRLLSRLPNEIFEGNIKTVIRELLMRILADENEYNVVIKHDEFMFIIKKKEFFIGLNDVSIKRIEKYKSSENNMKFFNIVTNERNLPISKNDFNFFLNGDCTLFASKFLMKHRLLNDDIYKLFEDEFAPSNYTLDRVNKMMKSMVYRAKQFAKENVLLLTILGLITAIVSLTVWSVGFYNSSETQIELDLKEKGCDDCIICESSPNMCPSYNLELIQPCKGGKMKRPATRKFSKHVSVAGKKRMVSDFEDDDDFSLGPQPSRVLSGIRHYFYNNGAFLKEFDSARVECAGKMYQASYRHTPDGIEFEIDYAYDKCSNEMNGWPKNLFAIYNDKGETSHALAITNQIFRFNAHMVHEVKEIGLTGRNMSLDVFYINRATDVAYGMLMTPDGNPATMPNVSSLIRKLIPMAEISRITECCMFSPDFTKQYVSRTKFYKTLVTPWVDENFSVTGDCYLMASGECSSSFAKKGACGAMLTTVLDGKEFLVGQFSAKRLADGVLLFSAISIDEWNEATREFFSMSSTKKCSDSFLCDVKQFMPKNEFLKEDKKVLMPKGFVSKLSPPVDPYYEPTGPGLEIIANANNPISMDTVDTRLPLCNGVFSEVFGTLKTPALPLSIIEKDHADRIPPDKNGNRRGYNIRLDKANRNVMPENGTARCVQYFKIQAVAVELGKYLREQTGNFNYEPMTVEDAIWGNKDIPALKRGKASGAAFQMIFPGVAKKGDIWNEERGIFNRGIGEIFKKMLTEQWDRLKNGDMLLLPSSTAMKSENLKDPVKKRIFHAIDPMTTVNGRRLLMPIQKAVERIDETPFILSIDPLTEFNKLAIKLNKHPNKAALDISSFDLTVVYELTNGAAACLAAIADMRPTACLMTRTFMALIAHMPLLVGTVLLKKQGGIPSGLPCTSLVDSVVVLLALTYYASIKVEDFTIAWFFNNIASIHCGDDTALSWSNEAEICGFDINDFCNFCMNKLSLEVTPAIKSGALEKTFDIREISFCSRMFVEVPGYKFIYSGKLKPEAMSSAIVHTKYTCDEEAEPMLETYQSELALWDDEYYNRFVHVLRHKTKLKVKIYSLAELRLNLHDRIKIATEERNFKYKDINKYTLLVDSTEIFSKDLKPFIPQTLTNKRKRNFAAIEVMSIARQTQILRETFNNAPSLGCFTKSEIFQEYLKLDIHIQLVSTRFEDVVVDVPQRWSPSFWFEFVKSLDSEIEPLWVVTVRNYPEPTGNTKKQIKDRALWTLAENFFLAMHGDIEPLQEMSRDAIVATQACCGEDKETTIEPDFVTKLVGCINGLLSENKEYELTKMNINSAQVVIKISKLGKKTSLRKAAVNAVAGFLDSVDADEDSFEIVDALHYPTIHKCSAAPPSDHGPEPNRDSNTVIVGESQPQVATTMFPGKTKAAGIPMETTMGPVAAPPIIQVSGGVGPELAYQTSYGENVVTLAYRKIFKEIVTVSTGTAQGTILADWSVDPWNERLLNPHAYSLAKLHERFFGSLMMHVQAVMAATFIGTIKIYFVPGLLSEKIELNQQALDATCDYVEINTRTTGEATLILKPTANNVALLGIKREDVRKNKFGRVIVMAATRIDNAYATVTQGQLKFAFSLGDGARYDTPSSLVSPKTTREDRPDLDLGYTTKHLLLLIDGLNKDGVDFSTIVSEKGRFIDNNLDMSGYMRGAIAVPVGPNTFNYDVFVVSGYRAVYQQNFNGDEHRDLITQMINSGNQGYKVAIANQFDFVSTDAYAHYNRFSKDIEYSNISISHKTQNVIRSASAFPFVAELNNVQKKIYFTPEHKVVFDEHGKFVMAATCFVEFGQMTNTTLAVTLDVENMFASTDRVPTIRIEGIPICTKSDITQPLVPAELLAVRVMDPGAITPAVGRTQKGSTVVGGIEHANSMINAVKAMSKVQAESVVTTIKSSGGGAVCSILRNSDGMFISRHGMPLYATMVANKDSVEQTHEFHGVKWPTIAVANAGSFKTRIAGQFSSALVGFKANAGRIEEMDDHLGENTFSNMIPKHAACAAMAAEMLAGEGAAAGSGGLNVFADEFMPSAGSQTEGTISRWPVSNGRAHFFMNDMTTTTGMQTESQMGEQVKGFAGQMMPSLGKGIGNGITGLINWGIQKDLMNQQFNLQKQLMDENWNQKNIYLMDQWKQQTKFYNDTEIPFLKYQMQYGQNENNLAGLGNAPIGTKVF
jgi:hypothetical protein